MAAYGDKLRRKDYNIHRRMGYEPRKRKLQRRLIHSEHKKTRDKETGGKPDTRPAGDFTEKEPGEAFTQDVQDIAELQFSRQRKKGSTPAARRAAKLKVSAPVTTASAKLHHEIDKRSGDNVGVEAANAGSAVLETGTAMTGDAIRSHHYAGKLKEREESGKASFNTGGETAGRRIRFSEENAGGSSGPDSGRTDHYPGGVGRSGSKRTAGTANDSYGSTSNPLSRFRQRQEIKRRYAEAAGNAVRGEGTTEAFSGIRSVSQRFKDAFSNLGSCVKEHPMVILSAGILMILLMAVAGGASSCSLLISGSGNGVVSTSFTAEDADILGCEEDYEDLEKDLLEEIQSVETENPDFDEYRYQLDTIGHNPYELASVLTILFEDYRRDDDRVQEMLKALFDAQYELIYDPVTEIRTREVERTGEREVYNSATGRTETETYTYTETEEYEYKILNVTMINHQLLQVIEGLDLAEDEIERFRIILSLKGNRAYLFGDDIYSNIDADADGTPDNPLLDYRVPGEALTDQEFARMYQEARKYLGRAYVWGGSTPDSGFDCSGYVCWVINASGVGSIGRTTAEGLRQWTTPISASERKPGDIVYFQGTYNTPGASHVGIYVGDGMMIHTGNPCKFSNIDSGYFADHMLGYGRIPDE